MMLSQQFLDVGTNPTALMPQRALEPMPLASDGRETVKVVLVGSPRAVTDTIRVLYLRGFAELYEWSPLQPTQVPGEVIALMRRVIRWA